MKCRVDRLYRHVITTSNGHSAAVNDQSVYFALFERAADAVLVADDEGVYVDANPAASTMLGYERSKIIGMRAADLVIDDEVPVEQRWSTFVSSPGESGRVRIRRGDGRVIVCDYSATSNVVPGRHMSILRDVTAAVEAENFRRQLEETVRHSVKMESMGRLASGVAHDFNNYLTLIGGHAEVLALAPELSAESSAHVEQIRAGADRAARLTRQLLAFGGRQVMNPAEMSIGDAVNRLVPMLTPMLGSSVRVVTTTASAERDVVLIDPSQFDQVIVNLAVNARDAMAEGGTLTFAVADTALDADSAVAFGVEPGSYVTLEVTDNGVGIDPATVDRIFEPFFTTKSSGNGTGLGLASVDGIVRQSGGAVTVTSEPGSGTTFTIYLPLVTESQPSPQ